MFGRRRLLRGRAAVFVAKCNTFELLQVWLFVFWFWAALLVLRYGGVGSRSLVSLFVSELGRVVCLMVRQRHLFRIFAALFGLRVGRCCVSQN